MMIEAMEVDAFVQNLRDLDKARAAMADHLESMSHLVAAPESQTEEQPVSPDVLDLPEVRNRLEESAKKLRSGTYRLLVLGDMKRGKSTFLNALLGENLLPAAVNPCTAIITILRYGEKPYVTVEYDEDSGKPPRQLSFDEFKRDFTIPPERAKAFAERGEKAFPDIKQAIVEYPLEMLEQGIEIVDSPGLNDNEDRTEITFSYLNNAHAVLFMLDATQPFTWLEETYLETSLKDRGLTIFFLINRWNLLRNQLIDPNDENELARSESTQRVVFRSGLSPYTVQNNQDRYETRVFEINALGALQKRLEGQPLEETLDTGVPQFVAALDSFLMFERGQEELGQAIAVGTEAANRAQEAVNLRIPNLYLSVEEIRTKIEAVQPQFDRLVEIKAEVARRIEEEGETQARAAGDSFEGMMTSLHETFETDFERVGGDIKMTQLLTRGGRNQIEQGMQESFESYMELKFTEWLNGPLNASLTSAAANLASELQEHGASYAGVTKDIAGEVGDLEREQQSLMGEVIDEGQPAWTRYAVGAAGILAMDPAAAVLGGAFGWKSALANIGMLLGINLLLVGVFGIALGPLGLIAVGGGLAAWRMRKIKNQVMTSMKEQLKNELPEVAETNRPKIEENVRETFREYKTDVEDQIQRDIDERRKELDDLAALAEGREFDAEEAKQALGAIVEGNGEMGLRRHLETMEDIYKGFGETQNPPELTAR